MEYLTGAIASPRHKLAGATPWKPRASIPDNFTRIPAKISMWGNSQYGCCVSTEEAFALDAFAGVFVTDAQLISWARAHRGLNGAMLTDIMDYRMTDGLPGGKDNLIGPYHSVDWENTAVLQDAIFQGPVKIGIASNQLPQGDTGWILLTARKDRNIDHCVSLCGYGSIAWCCEKLGVNVPNGADPNQPAYHLFTWDSIGVITQSALNGVCGEAWLRTPTIVGVTPPTPTPTPTPDPGPPPAPPKPDPVPGPNPTPFDWTALINAILAILEALLKKDTK